MKRLRIDDYSGPTCTVLDVSHWQGDIDWPRVARSEAMHRGASQGPVRLVVVRTGDGKDTDRHAVRNLRGAHEAGLPVAAYHYVRAMHGAAVNLGVIREVLATAGVPVVFVAPDIEGRPDDPRTPDTDESRGAWLGGVDTQTVLRETWDMGTALERDGHRVIVYTGTAWQQHVAARSQHSAAWLRWPLWVPDYLRGRRARLPVDAAGKGAPWPSWLLWQYTGHGRIAGIDGDVDLSRYRGDARQLAEWIADRDVSPPNVLVASVDELHAIAERLRVAGHGARADRVAALAGELSVCG